MQQMLTFNSTLQGLHLYANHVTSEGMAVFRDTVQVSALSQKPSVYLLLAACSFHQTDI